MLVGKRKIRNVQRSWDFLEASTDPWIIDSSNYPFGPLNLRTIESFLRVALATCFVTGSSSHVQFREIARTVNSPSADPCYFRGNFPKYLLIYDTISDTRSGYRGDFAKRARIGSERYKRTRRERQLLNVTGRKSERLRGLYEREEDMWWWIWDTMCARANCCCCCAHSLFFLIGFRESTRGGVTLRHGISQREPSVLPPIQIYPLSLHLRRSRRVALHREVYTVTLERR